MTDFCAEVALEARQRNPRAAVEMARAVLRTTEDRSEWAIAERAIGLALRDEIGIDFLPDLKAGWAVEAKKARPRTHFHTLLGELLPGASVNLVFEFSNGAAPLTVTRPNMVRRLNVDMGNLRGLVRSGGEERRDGLAQQQLPNTHRRRQQLQRRIFGTKLVSPAMQGLQHGRIRRIGLHQDSNLRTQHTQTHGCRADLCQGPTQPGNTYRTRISASCLGQLQ